VEFKFCLDKSISENANYYFEKAKKIKNKIEGEKKKIELIKKKIEELKRKKEVEEKKEKEMKELLKLIKKGEWYEKFRWFFTSKGNLVVCGKDQTSNEVLIKKYSKNFKLVFHTEMPGSPFCLTNADSEEEKKEVADFVAIFSQAWKSNLASVDVFYVKPGQLKKNDPKGVVLPKGSFYIEGKKNFILGETKFSVGICIDKENKTIKEIRFGPYSTISKVCDYYITIVPGKKSRKQLAQEIAKKLKIKHWQVIQEFIPSNGEIAKALTRTP
jgi:predicted ribosome quality control (RQC) complex YloA/Tae2 family protein